MVINCPLVHQLILFICLKKCFKILIKLLKKSYSMYLECPVKCVHVVLYYTSIPYSLTPESKISFNLMFEYEMRDPWIRIEFRRHNSLYSLVLWLIIKYSELHLSLGWNTRILGRSPLQQRHALKLEHAMNPLSNLGWLIRDGSLYARRSVYIVLIQPLRASKFLYIYTRSCTHVCSTGK